MDISAKQKITRRFRLLIILSIISVLASIVSLVLILRVSSILTFDRNERLAREFVEKIVDSINQNTDYYQYHCSKDAFAYSDNTKITNNFKITLIRAESSYYEYDLTFDGINKFRVDVTSWPHNNFKIIHFALILKKVDR